MSAAFTKGQKCYLAQLATRAFNRERALALGRGDEWTHKVEAWRHEQVALACGRLGLRCCGQDDYGAVKAHFLALLGEEGKAVQADVRGRPEANRQRVVEYKIVEVLKEIGKEVPYAMAICKRMFRGKGLWDVTERDLWKVFYALRYEALRRNRQHANGN